MSAFERLPASYRGQCVAYGSHMGHMGRMGLLSGRHIALSPQNRRVRFAVDRSLALARTFPNRVYRQQRKRGAAG